MNWFFKKVPIVSAVIDHFYKLFVIKMSLVLTLCPVETERKLMTDSYMIQAGIKFKFHFINSMVD